jgi:two-component system sensor histidine kinase RegB
MRVCVTDTPAIDAVPDLRSAGDRAPDLARPWVVRMRYGMLAAQLALLVFLAAGLRMDLPWGWLAIPLALTFSSNLIFRQALLGELFCLDTICLTVVLGLTGGPMNPFSLLYLVQIMLSAMILSKTWTWALGLLSTFCFGLLFWFNRPVPAFSPHHEEGGFSLHLAGMWIAFAIAATLITIFIGKVAESIRDHEREALNLRDRLAKSERLASLVTLAAGAAHELGTPLGTIAVAARELERLAGPGNILEDAKLIRAEVARCRLILERMTLDGAETPGETPVPIDPGHVLSDVAARFQRYPELQILAPAPNMIAVLPRQATVQAVSALVKNALDANANRKPVTLRAEMASGSVRFVVEDHGGGMPPEVLAHIAEPFFTTKQPGSGMGLGTFLVRMFAEHLNGRLSFDSTVGRGSTAILELPVIQA